MFKPFLPSISSLLFTVMAVFITPAHAATIAGNAGEPTNNGSNIGIGSGQDQAVAASFTLGNAPATAYSIRALLMEPTPSAGPDGTPPLSQPVVKICASSTSDLPDESRCSDAFSQADALPTSADWVTFNGNHHLEANTKYWVVISNANTGKFTWGVPNSEPPNGAVRYNGVPWHADIQPSFSVIGTIATTPIPTATNTGMVSAQIASPTSNCAFDSDSVSTFVPPAYQGIAPPHGALRFKLVGCAIGETVRVSVTWPSTAGLRVMKYGKNPTSPSTDVYYAPDNASINGNTVSYDVTDNGLGDDVFTGADGVINDPVALVTAPALATTGIPTLSQWGQLILLAALALLGVHHVRRRTQRY